MTGTADGLFTAAFFFFCFLSCFGFLTMSATLLPANAVHNHLISFRSHPFKTQGGCRSDFPAHLKGTAYFKDSKTNNARSSLVTKCLCFSAINVICFETDKTELLSRLGWRKSQLALHVCSHSCHTVRRSTPGRTSSSALWRKALTWTKQTKQIKQTNKTRKPTNNELAD